MHIPLDYETLRLIWWVLLGVLLIGFALTDGYDLGVASLLPFVARTDEERRQAINAIAPHWEGHQVWLILGGGAIFAAWPFVYAVSFSGFYLAMFLVLAALILRPVSFKYRSKHADAGWRARWDWALFTGGFVPALVFGVAVGNVLAGAPFRFDSDLRMTYEGTLLGLFTPFTVLAGLLSVAMLAMHGAAWLAVKVADGPVVARARRFGLWAAAASVALFALGGWMVAHGGMGMRLVGVADAGGPSNPLLTASTFAPGAWLDNFAAHPWMVAAPVAGLLAPLLAMAGIAGRLGWLQLAGSALS
ncbi:MAG TPA: cytochrome d ubiquinol oxidase subunit II, partial [Novosphingobium sp.]|nr:cytochrome d ubiquinol oxidase subunit II [Novosphingobium sp.]